MFGDMPAGMLSFCRSGANPIRPDEVLAKLRAAVVALQEPPPAQQIAQQG
jgi:hypothetical protein